MSNGIKEPLRILILRIGAMGDVLHALPAVAGLRAALPDSRIGWAIEPRWLPLLQGADGSMPLVDIVHPVPTKEWKLSPFSPQTINGVAKLRRELGAERYDLAFDIQGSIKSALVGWISGAKCRLGAHDPRESQARLFYNRSFVVSEENVINQAGELLSMGVGRHIPLALADFPVDRKAERWCDQFLDSLTVAQTPFALLAPTAGWGAKEWGASKFAGLARELSRGGLKVLINKDAGSPDGSPEAIAKASDSPIAASTLPQLVALTRRAALVVGGDTGPVHLGAALGRPVVALFGPTDPHRNGPYFPGARVEVLRNPFSKTSHKRRSATEAGLAAIIVEEVVAASFRILASA